MYAPSKEALTEQMVPLVPGADPSTQILPELDRPEREGGVYLIAAVVAISAVEKGRRQEVRIER